MSHIFLEVASDPIAYLSRHTREVGLPVAITNSPLFPLELLDGLGMYSIWLPPVVRPAYVNADRWVQVFMCARAKSFLDIASGRQFPVALIASPIDCDAKDVTLGILQAAGIKTPLLQFRQPIRLDSPSSMQFMYDGLRQVLEDAEKLGLAFSESLFFESCRLREEARKRLRQVFDGIGREFDPVLAYAAAISYQVMRPQEFLEAFSLSELANSRDGLEVFLIGSELPSLAYVQTLHDMGALVVADDTWTGSRAASMRMRLEDCQGDSLELALQGLAQALLEMRHGPTKVGHMSERIKTLVSKGVAKGARAAIFLLFKFCDPHAFEAPELIEAFKGVRIRSLVIEVEKEARLVERERTRLATLIESL